MLVALIIACIAIALFCNRQNSHRDLPKTARSNDFALGKTASFFLMEECVEQKDAPHKSSNEFHGAAELIETETDCFEDEF